MLRPLPAFEVKGIMTSKVFSKGVTHSSSAGPWDVSFIVKNGNTVRILEKERERARVTLNRWSVQGPSRGFYPAACCFIVCGSEQLTSHPVALPSAPRAEEGRGAPFATHVKLLVRRMFTGVTLLRKGCS